MKNIMVTVSCVLLVGAFVAVETCKAQEIKIAFVDTQQFGQKSKKARELMQKFQQLVQSRQNELQSKVALFKQMQDELQKQGPLMKEEMRNKKLEELQIEQIKLKRMEEEYTKGLQNEEYALRATLQRDVTKIVDQIRAKKGLTVVFNREFFISADGTLDLTDEVAHAYDAAPGGGESSAPAPAPKPKAPVAPPKPKAPAPGTK